MGTTTVTVKINGLEYNLKGREDEEYLKHVANYVEKKIQELTNMNRNLTTPAASALAAINIADELFKGNREYNELAAEYEIIEKENSALKSEISELKEENQRAEEESNVLRVENESLSEKITSIDNSDMETLEAEIERLKEELILTESKARELIDENMRIKSEKRELKFNLQSSKYKLLDLEKKFGDSQVKLAVERQSRNALLRAKK